MKHFAKYAAIFAMLLFALLVFSQEKTEPSPSQAAPSAQARQASPQPVHVSGSTLQKMIVSRVNPKFTKEQEKERKKKRIQGPVHLLVIIGPTGDVSEVRAIDGDPLLANATVDAVKQWKFKPYLLNGTAVEAEATLMFNFTLSGD